MQRDPRADRDLVTQHEARDEFRAVARRRHLILERQQRRQHHDASMTLGEPMPVMRVITIDRRRPRHRRPRQRHPPPIKHHPRAVPPAELMFRRKVMHDPRHIGLASPDRNTHKIEQTKPRMRPHRRRNIGEAEVMDEVERVGRWHRDVPAMISPGSLAWQTACAWRVGLSRIAEAPARHRTADPRIKRSRIKRSPNKTIQCVFGQTRGLSRSRAPADGTGDDQLICLNAPPRARSAGAAPPHPRRGNSYSYRPSSYEDGKRVRSASREERRY
jgi:hypothetical protein